MRHTTCIVFALLSAPALAHAQRPAAADVLKAASDYLVQYTGKLATVAAEEVYTQRDTASVQINRRLQSDLVLIGHDGGSISAFRDVFAIDGNPVRERDDRLLKSFNSPIVAAAHAEATAFTEQAVRYYISPNLRILDLPTTTLEFLRPVNQDSSEFSVDGVRKQDGVQVATLKFKARTTSGLLPTPEGSQAEGRVWVEIGTGIVRQTELLVHGATFSFKVTTKYKFEPALGLWVPAELVQFVDIRSAAGGFSNMGGGGQMGGRQSVEGRVQYSGYRRAKKE